MLNVNDLKAIIDEARDGNYKAIKEFKEAKRYYSGKMLPDDVIAVLNERGQPPIHENILAMIMEKIKGYKDMARTDMEVIGRQKADRDTAAVLTDILKAVTDTKEFISEKRRCDQNLLLGLGVFEVWIKESPLADALGKKEKIITVDAVEPSGFFIDPFSVKPDASDAKYFVKSVSMDFSDAKRMFGNKAAELRVAQINGWRKRTAIKEIWVKEFRNDKFEWDRYILGEPYALLRYEKRPFKSGNHPFAIQKYAIDDENNWYGFFRNLKPQIDFINFAENRMANMIGSTKIFYESGAVDDAETFAKEANLDNAVVRVRDNALSSKKIEIVSNQPQIANLSAKIAETRMTAQRLSGLNDETLGFAVSRLSGSAIEQRNNAGTVSLQSFLIASEMIDKAALSKAVELVTHYFDAEQVFRIVESDNAERYFTINEVVRDENGAPTVSEGKILVRNKISVGAYDISLNTTPHVKTKREDILKHWAEIIKTITPIDPSMTKNLIPLMLDDSDSPVASKVREMLMNKADEEAAAPQNNEAQTLQLEAMKLELEKTKAEISKIKADTLKKVAESKEEMGRARI